MRDSAIEEPLVRSDEAAPRRARLKAAFISGLMAWQTVIFAHSAWLIFARGRFIGALGSLLASGAILGFFATVALRGLPRTSANLPWVVGLSASGMTLAIGGFGSPGGTLTLAYAIAAFASTVAYVYWYSRLDRRESVLLAVGSTLPDFDLQEPDGTTVGARTLRGRPTVLLFFRGNWCPLCMAQIRELAEQYRELDRSGAQVVLVSPQSHDKTRDLAERFDVPMRFLVDAGSAAARRLGIAHDGGLPAGMEALGYDRDTVLPTVVVTDADGRILFSDQTDNYRVRPEPKTFLRVLDQAATGDTVR